MRVGGLGPPPGSLIADMTPKQSRYLCDSSLICQEPTDTLGNDGLFTESMSYTCLMTAYRGRCLGM